MAARTAWRMASQMVENDGVAKLKCRDQELLDIGEQVGSVDRSVEHGWRIDSVMSQGREEGGHLPISMRHFCAQPLTRAAAPLRAGQVGLDPGITDEDVTQRRSADLANLENRIAA